ncbi:MAG: argininosuccinate lyase [Chitinophagaceae bacterium]|jgi:argininosuccinate lyase|nr:argininosuccinate lyase [Chitinophagaceae bacterium]
MKLWQKDSTETQVMVEQFTVGRDKEFDVLLAPYDVQGNKAQAAMLYKIGVLTAAEHAALQTELDNLYREVMAPGFVLPEEVEDIHSYIELMLTERVGDAGKKIHTGRSRNDQVAVDIKLFLKDKLLEVSSKTRAVFDLFLQQAEANATKLMPGYTHLQLAMPSSAGLWLGAYAESLTDDLEMLAAAYRIVNKNPLGSGAGYGSSFALDREYTTEVLGFAATNISSVYAQMTRGKAEKAVATGMAYIAATLGRFAYDCCLFLNQHFAFISFPDSLTTGSSIMPHKKNPDVFELIRAKCNLIQAVPQQLALLLNNLPSGYHRDLQLTKEVLFPAINTLLECMDMTSLMLNNLTVKDDLLEEEKFRYLFTVEAMNELVQNGLSYRDAYKTIGNQVNEGSFVYKPSSVRHTHLGSIGNPGFQHIRRAMHEAEALFR